MTGQFQLEDRLLSMSIVSTIPTITKSPKSFVSIILINRQFSKSIVRALAIRTPPSKPTVEAIPTNRQCATTIIHTTTIIRKSRKLIASTMAIGMQSKINCRYNLNPLCMVIMFGKMFSNISHMNTRARQVSRHPTYKHRIRHFNITARMSTYYLVGKSLGYRMYVLFALNYHIAVVQQC